jgi:hypothetical protein
MALTIIAITMAIALVTAGSLNASVLAARSSKSSRGGGSTGTGTLGALGGGPTGTLGGTATSSRSSSAGASPRTLMSDFVKCLRSAGTSTSSLGTTSGVSRGGAAMLTRADVTNCYDSVYKGTLGGAGGTLGSTGGAGGAGGAGGSSLGGEGGGTSPSG